MIMSRRFLCITNIKALMVDINHTMVCVVRSVENADGASGVSGSGKQAEHGVGL